MRIKVQKDYFKYFIFAFLLLPPKIIAVIPSMNIMSNCITACSVLMAFVLFCQEIIKSKKKTSMSMFIFIILIVWLEVVNLLHNSIGRNFLFEIIPAVGMALLIDKVFRNSKEQIFLEAFGIYGTLIVILNLVSELLCGSDGIYHNWETSWQSIYLCGNANSYVFFYLVVLSITIACAMYSKRWVVLSYIIHLSMIWSNVILGDSRSSTGLLIIVIALIFRLMSNHFIRNFLLKHYKYVVIGLCAVGVWFFVMNGWRSEWFLDFARTVLGENVSLIARGTIWNNAMARIKLSPWLGYGTNAVNISADLDGVLRSAHNNYFEISIMGGLPALALYILLIWSCIRKSSQKSECSYMIFMCLTLNLVAFFVEQNPFYIGFYFLLWLYKNVTGGGTAYPEKAKKGTVI